MFWGDYFLDTTHLTTEEHGAYLLLIARYWSDQKPLKDDDNFLRMITKTSPKAWKRLSPIIKAFFICKDGMLHHKRIDAEIIKLQARQKRGHTGGVSKAENIRKSRIDHYNKHVTSKQEANASDQQSITTSTTTSTNITPISPLSPTTVNEFGLTTHIIDCAREHAPGWDINYLINQWSNWQSKQEVPARDKNMSFLAYVKRYTKGKPPH